MKTLLMEKVNGVWQSIKENKATVAVVGVGTSVATTSVALAVDPLTSLDLSGVSLAGGISDIFKVAGVVLTGLGVIWGIKLCIGMFRTGR